MRRNTLAVGVGGFLVVFCAGLVLLVGSRSAGAASGGPPDLGNGPDMDIGVGKLTDGRRVLRFSTVIVNVGAGVFEVRGSRATTTAPMSTVVQRVYNGAGGYSDSTIPTTMVWGGDGHNHWHIHDLGRRKLLGLTTASRWERGSSSDTASSTTTRTG